MSLDLMSGLVQGFSQSYQQKEQRQLADELKKFQVKIFKQQLDQQEKKQSALDQITQALMPVLQAQQVPQEDELTRQQLPPMEQQVMSQPPKPQEFFASPKGFGLGMQAGLPLDDLSNIARGRPGENLMNAIIQQYFPQAAQGMTGATPQGGMGAPQGPQGAVTQGGTPQGGFGNFVPNIGVDSTGKVNVDLKPSKVVWKDIGNDFIAVDETTGQPRQGVAPIAKNETYVQTVMEGDQPRITVFNKRTNAPVAVLGTPEQKVPLSDSTRIALAEQGAANINQIIGALMPDGKTIDRGVILQMDAPMGGVGQGRELNQLASTAIAAQILLQSGVTARPDELEELRRTYLPTTLDLTNEGLAKRKIERFQKLLEGSVDIATLPESLRKRIDKQRKTKSKVDSSLPAGWTVKEK